VGDVWNEAGCDGWVAFVLLSLGMGMRGGGKNDGGKVFAMSLLGFFEVLCGLCFCWVKLWWFFLKFLNFVATFLFGIVSFFLFSLLLFVGADMLSSVSRPIFGRPPLREKASSFRKE